MRPFYIDLAGTLHLGLTSDRYRARQKAVQATQDAYAAKRVLRLQVYHSLTNRLGPAFAIMIELKNQSSITRPTTFSPAARLLSLKERRKASHPVLRCRSTAHGFTCLAATAPMALICPALNGYVSTRVRTKLHAKGGVNTPRRALRCRKTVRRLHRILFRIKGLSPWRVVDE